jgi:hypothetical protein
MLYWETLNSHRYYKMQSRSTSRSIAQDIFVPLKPQKEAPINAFPIFRDHLNAVCHTKMRRMDQRIENSTENAKSKQAIRSHELTFNIVLPLYRANHGLEESSPCGSSMLPGKRAPKQIAWT